MADCDTGKEEPDPEELSRLLLLELSSLGISTKSLKAVLSFSDITNKAVALLVKDIPLIECFLQKVSKLFEDIMLNVDAMLAVENVHTFIKVLASGEHSKWVSEQCAVLKLDKDVFSHYAKYSNTTLLQLKFVNEHKRNLKQLLVENDAPFTNATLFTDLSICTDLYFILNIIDITLQTVTDKKLFLVSEVSMYMHLIRKKLCSLKLASATGRSIRDVALKTLDGWIEKRTTKSEIHSSALFMDPRTKTTLHLADKGTAYATTLRRLTDTLRNMCPEESDDEECDADECASDENMQSLLSNFNMSDFTEKRGGHSKTEVAIEALKLYLHDLHIEGSDVNPCKFWSARAEAEPEVANLALSKLRFPGKRIISLSKLAQSKYFGRQSQADMRNALFLASASDELAQ